jgi:hypothetical protein
MPPDVRYNQSHHAGPDAEARIAARLRNSGDCDNADTVVQNGNSAQRVFHNIHHSGTQGGSRHEGER